LAGHRDELAGSGWIQAVAVAVPEGVALPEEVCQSAAEADLHGLDGVETPQPQLSVESPQRFDVVERDAVTDCAGAVGQGCS
jgi:hypothetical protein